MHMSKKQYLKAINKEIQKLNGIIDFKILHEYDYHREARRHKKLLNELRKEEMRSAFSFLVRPLTFSWF